MFNNVLLILIFIASMIITNAITIISIIICHHPSDLHAFTGGELKANYCISAAGKSLFLQTEIVS